MIIGFLLTLAGTAALCVAMKKHFRQMFPHKEYSPRNSRVYRAVGYVLVIAGAYACTVALGTGIGLAVFFGLWTVAILLIAFLLPVYSPPRQQP